MKAKNLMVSFMAIAAVFVLAATVSAASNNYNISNVWVNDLTADDHGTVSFEAGDTLIVEVFFSSGEFYDKDVTVEVELDGDDFRLSDETSRFDVLPNRDYKKTLRLEVPNELDDQLFDDDVELEVTIEGDDSEGYEDYTLTVKRESYNVAIKSITVDQSVSAGERFAVDVILENIGYNDLDDLFVTASIPTLGVQKTGFFGDVVALECDDDEEDFPWNDSTLGRFCDEDDEDSVNGQLMLEVPYDVKAGVYTLEVAVSNDDASSRETVEILVENDFEKNVFKSGNTLHVVNPTDSVKGYRIVPESPASVSESIVFVSPGMTEEISVEPNADGDYEFDVSIFTLKGELVDTMTFSGKSADGTADDGETNPVVILTVVLAIIFVVLLIVLIVLIGKKPEKSGEFGESYY